MAWVVTLQIVDCASPSTNLSGATINDGYNIFFTDPNGQFIAIVNDIYTGYVVSIGKSGYISKNFALSKSMNGSIQNVCLTKRPPSTGGGSSGGGGGGW